MTSSKEFRRRAREVLNGKYGRALIAMLIYTIVSSLISLISVNTDSVFLSMAYSILNIIFSVIIVMPMGVGVCRYFLNQTIGVNGVESYSDLLFAIREDLTNTVKITFVQSIRIFFWSLLFVIPGIIKSYEYAMIPFILAENPHIDINRAFDITKAMMNGNKMRYFLLNLSFFGWLLLGACLAGVGVVFVMPYIQASVTQFYLEVKERAMLSGAIGADELTRNDGRSFQRDPFEM